MEQQEIQSLLSVVNMKMIYNWPTHLNDSIETHSIYKSQTTLTHDVTHPITHTKIEVERHT